MQNKSIMFIKPALETDAVWDPIRTSSYLGIWYLASFLKEKGYGVRYLDEVFRNKGFNKRQLFERSIKGDKITDTPLSISYDEFEKQKINNFNILSPSEFTQKYTAFKEGKKITRIMARTGNPLEETLAEIERTNPAVVGLPLIATCNYMPTVAMGRAIRERFPSVKIVCGGHHISTAGEKFLEENDWADHLVIGDAVNVIEDVINGVYQEKIVAGRFNDMKDFPLLDPSLLDENNYPNEPTYSYSSSGRKTVDFMFTKGCTGNCEYCYVSSLRREDRYPTAIPYDRVDEQLRIFKEHGIEEIIVEDDDLFGRKLGKDHFPKILGLMKKHGMYWQDNGGVKFELLSKKLTDAIIQYNKEGEGRCTYLYIPLNVRSWNKGQSATDTMINKYPANLKNLKRLRKEGGIHILTSDIIGAPDQTEKIIKEDIEIHKKLIRDGYIDGAATFSATYLPGTQWGKKYRNMIVNETDYAGYSFFTTHHGTNHIPNPQTVEELVVLRNKKLNEVQTSYPWETAFPNDK